MDYIVVVPCHFEEPGRLCSTTIARLRVAGGLWSKSQCRTRFILTGNVPYERGGKTLAGLMAEWLTREGVTPELISIGEGFGIFSEAGENMTPAKCPDADRITIVSSSWYFLPAERIWRYYAWRSGLILPISMRKVRTTGGVRARIFYAIYGLVVHTAFVLGLQEALGKRLTRMQSARAQGFKMKGC